MKVIEELAPYPAHGDHSKNLHTKHVGIQMGHYVSQFLAKQKPGPNAFGSNIKLFKKYIVKYISLFKLEICSSNLACFCRKVQYILIRLKPYDFLSESLIYR